MKIGQRLFMYAALIVITLGYLWGNQLSLVDVIDMVPFWWLALSVVLAAYSVFLHVILHELGHLIAGKMSGYQLIYFQTPFFRYQGGSGFEKNRPLAGGILGQCLMSPPEKVSYEEKPYRLYMTGGLIMNGLAAMLLYLGSFVLPGQWGFYSFVFSVPPFWLFLANTIPFDYRDGRVLLELRKSPLSRRLFFKQLETAKWAEEGRNIQDFPEDHFIEARTGEAAKSFLGEYTILMEYQRQIAAYNFPQAEQVLQAYMENWNYMESAYARQVGCEILFCHSIFGREKEAKEMRTHIEAYSGLKGQYDRNYRVQAAYAFFVEKDIEKTRNLLNTKESLVLNEMEQAIENRLKDWLNNYLVYLS